MQPDAGYANQTPGIGNGHTRSSSASTGLSVIPDPLSAYQPTGSGTVHLSQTFRPRMPPLTRLVLLGMGGAARYQRYQKSPWVFGEGGGLTGFTRIVDSVQTLSASIPPFPIALNVLGLLGYGVVQLPRNPFDRSARWLHMGRSQLGGC